MYKSQPNYILWSTIGGDAKYSGFLNNFISVQDYEEDLYCNIVDVKISSDLLNGKVYFRTLNDLNLPNQKVFEKFASMIRHELASNTDLKRIPKFTFILDTSIENANHIEDLLNLKWEMESS